MHVRLRFLSIAFGAFASAFPGLANVALPDTRPNILLIVSEDNGPELGVYGDPYVQTPHLDQMAREGVRFTRAYVTQAGCSQSRSSILTGKYPHQNGQLGLATWNFRMYDAQTPNIARSLKDAGYRTGLIGKLHVNPPSAFTFDFEEIPRGNFARKGLGDYARHAETFFKTSAQPFFLSINYPEAHRPWTRQVDGLPAKPLTGDDVKALPYFGVDDAGIREMVADYYNCMSRLDSLIGDLLAALERSGKADNTCIVYLGDHGADLLRGKRTSYEGGVRIPLIVRWPGAKSGQVREELVSTVDLMPTLLVLAQAAPVDGLAGRSLLPLLKNESAEWRRYLFTEFHSHSARETFWPQRTVRNARYKLIENLLPGEINPGYEFTLHHFEGVDISRAIDSAPPTVRAAYARMRSPPQWELYDLQSDPFEFKNLAEDAAHAEALHELQIQLARWRRETVDPLLDPENLQRLKAEMQAANRQKTEWNYPHYFFGHEPPPQSKDAPQEKAHKPRKKSP